MKPRARDEKLNTTYDDGKLGFPTTVPGKSTVQTLDNYLRSPLEDDRGYLA